MDSEQTLDTTQLEKLGKYIQDIFKLYKLSEPSIQQMLDTVDFALDCNKIFYYEWDTFLKKYTNDIEMGWGILCYKGQIWLQVAPVQESDPVLGSDEERLVGGSKTAIEDMLCNLTETLLYKKLNTKFFKIY